MLEHCLKIDMSDKHKGKMKEENNRMEEDRVEDKHVLDNKLLDKLEDKHAPEDKHNIAQATKYEFISRLAMEGLYEYLIAMLARNRFSRTVAEKIMSVLVLACRYYKPL